MGYKHYRRMLNVNKRRGHINSVSACMQPLATTYRPGTYCRPSQRKVFSTKKSLPATSAKNWKGFPPEPLPVSGTYGTGTVPGTYRTVPGTSTLTFIVGWMKYAWPRFFVSILVSMKMMIIKMMMMKTDKTMEKGPNNMAISITSLCYHKSKRASEENEIL